MVHVFHADPAAGPHPSSSDRHSISPVRRAMSNSLMQALGLRARTLRADAGCIKGKEKGPLLHLATVQRSKLCDGGGFGELSLHSMAPGVRPLCRRHMRKAARSDTLSKPAPIIPIIALSKLIAASLTAPCSAYGQSVFIISLRPQYGKLLNRPLVPRAHSDYPHREQGPVVVSQASFSQGFLLPSILGEMTPDRVDQLSSLTNEKITRGKQERQPTMSHAGHAGWLEASRRNLRTGIQCPHPPLSNTLNRSRWCWRRTVEEEHTAPRGCATAYVSLPFFAAGIIPSSRIA
jgi:hypothetical protein